MGWKNWLAIVMACLAIVLIYQLVRMSKDDLIKSPAPVTESAPKPQRPTANQASLAEPLGLLQETRRPVPVIEPAESKEPQESPAPVAEAEAPSKQEQQEAPAETAPTPEPVEAVEAETPPSPVSDSPEAVPVLESSKRGLVRGIVYSEDHGSAFVGRTMVKTGAIIDGIKVVNISAAGVEFEKNGRRWTQKVGQAPSEQWR